VEGTVQKGLAKMKNQRLLLLSILLLSSCLILYQPEPSYQQTTPEGMQTAMHGPDNCPITHAYASRLYVPVTLKIIHDATPNFQVTSHSITNNTNSVVTLDGNDKNAFLITTDSTDQFVFRTIASYSDNQEHPIMLEVWSQNLQLDVNEFSTVKGYFCHDFFIDTSVAPPQPDIPKSIQQAEGQTFQQMFDAIIADHLTVGNLTIVNIAGDVLMLIIFIIFLIYTSRGDSKVGKLANKLTSLTNHVTETVRNTDMTSKHLFLHEKVNEDKLAKMVQYNRRFLTSFIDTFLVNFRTVLMETGHYDQNKLEPLEKLNIQIQEAMKDQVEEKEPELPIEILQTVTHQQESLPSKDTRSIIKSIFRIHKKDVTKEEMKTKEEWKQFYKDKGLTPKQVLAAYSKLEPYVNANFKDDPESKNKLDALYELYFEDKAK
jgi:hypothetical protein